jgi:hypothetical protein
MILYYAAVQIDDPWQLFPTDAREATDEYVNP